MILTTKHWTEQSVDAFVHRIATDFVSQIENRMKEKTVSNAELADSLSVTAGRVSQILNNPGNLTLRNIVRCSRSLSMKVAIVAYDDGDAENRNGPVNSELFYQCWQNSGRPTDFVSLAESSSRNCGYLILSSVNCVMAVSGQVVVGTTVRAQAFVSCGTVGFVSTTNEMSTWSNAIVHEQSTTSRDFQLTGGRV